MIKIRDCDIWFLNKMRTSIKNFDVLFKGRKVTNISLNREHIGRSKYQITLDNGSTVWVDPTKLVYDTQVHNGERLGIQ